MRELLPRAERVARLLIERKATVSVAESAAGGLISAALLAVPGASAYYIGGMVIYTRRAYDALHEFREEELLGARSSTEKNAIARARIAREKFGTTWGIGETGAAGPAGNRYGDPAGHAYVAVCGPIEKARHVLTHGADRMKNMHAFAAAALDLLAESL